MPVIGAEHPQCSGSQASQNRLLRHSQSAHLMEVLLEYFLGEAGEHHLELRMNKSPVEAPIVPQYIGAHGQGCVRIQNGREGKLFDIEDGLDREELRHEVINVFDPGAH